jgi:pimeloyl-ACP methyl ester carboxylesterase
MGANATSTPNPVGREFVALTSPTAGKNPAGFHPCQGVYYTPPGKRPKVAFIASHYNVDFSEHYLAPLLAERGFGFLGWNTRYRGSDTFFILDHALVDIGVGVRWLREVAGVDVVVILGNSGGGSLMGAYQSQATEPHVTATVGLALTSDVEQLLPADLYVSLNAHLGRPEVLTDWWDPSVTDESDPMAVDPALDMYNPDNGPPYAEEFLGAYRAAQVERNHRVTGWVLAEIDRLAAGGAFERVFSVARVWADLRFLDGTLDPSDRAVGTCYAGDPRWANGNAWGLASTNSLRTWLSMWSLEHSQCRGVPHLQRITAPALVIQSTADTGVFPSDGLAVHEYLASADKELHLIAGDHYLRRPTEARSDVADLISAWVASR